MLEAIDTFHGHWVAWERAGGLVRIRVTDRATGVIRYVEFPEPVYEAYPGPNPEWDTGELRYNYESPVTPGSVYDYNVISGASTLLKRREVLGGFDPSRYGCERMEVAAADGATIPVSMVFRRDRPLDLAAPTLLTGYGAYGIPFPVGFSSNRLSLLDRGVRFAIAHVRGGGELGKRWHDAGRMGNKMNSFTDFIAVAEALVARGIVAPGRAGPHPEIDAEGPPLRVAKQRARCSGHDGFRRGTDRAGAAGRRFRSFGRRANYQPRPASRRCIPWDRRWCSGQGDDRARDNERRKQHTHRPEARQVRQPN